MKAIILILSVFTFSVYTCNAKNPPDAVAKAFTQKFATAEKVKWDQEEADEWEAEFIQAGKEMSASFDLSGKWLETETEIEKNELPSTVKSALDKNFAGAEIGEVSIIDSPEFNGYEVELKYQEKKMEVQISKEGKIYKKAVGNGND